MKLHRLAFCAALLVFPLSLASAQAITGRVVSSTGAGVPGVNIDCFDNSGNDIDLANDGTDANGNFTTTVLDGPGVYRFVFYPPAPPATTHLVGERNNVVVTATTNLGTIALGAGVLLSGRTVRTGNLPVANVTLLLIDGPTGVPLTEVQAKTNAFGQFNLAAPLHACELRLDATSSAFVLGSRFFELVPSAAVPLGDVLLPPGALVTGHVQRANGTPVAGVDLDFDKAATGHGVYVPNDNTNVSGNFSVVVAKNTYDVEFCADPVDLLATRVLTNRSITTTTNLGTIVMSAGVKLFGTVLDAHGHPAGKVDLDAFVHATGAPVPTCHDDTNASGAYSIVVPTGTYDVVFTPAGAGAAIGGDWHRNVIVAGTTQLDGTLSPNGYGNSFAGPPPFGPTIVPLVAAGTGPRAAPIAGVPTLSLTPVSEGAALLVEGLAPAARAWLLVAATPGGVLTRWPLAPSDEHGRTRLTLAPLGLDEGYLRVVVPGRERDSASTVYRLER
jgi:hypothetical protein